MRTLLLAAATLISLGVAAADARPIVVVEPVVAGPVVVGGGCGFGFHHGPYGGCVRNGAVVVTERVFPRYVVHCGPHRTAFGWRGGCHY